MGSCELPASHGVFVRLLHCFPHLLARPRSHQPPPLRPQSHLRAVPPNLPLKTRDHVRRLHLRGWLAHLWCRAEHASPDPGPCDRRRRRSRHLQWRHGHHRRNHPAPLARAVHGPARRVFCHRLRHRPPHRRRVRRPRIVALVLLHQPPARRVRARPPTPRPADQPAHGDEGLVQGLRQGHARPADAVRLGRRGHRNGLGMLPHPRTAVGRRYALVEGRRRYRLPRPHGRAYPRLLRVRDLARSKAPDVQTPPPAPPQHRRRDAAHVLPLRSLHE